MTERKLVLGIDPGVTGAYAFVRLDTPSEGWAVFDFPKNTCESQIFKVLTCYRDNIEAIFIEKPVAFGMGVKGAFTYGLAYGYYDAYIKAVELGESVRGITPMEWQNGLLRLPAKIREDSKRTRREAIKACSLEYAREYFKESEKVLARKKDNGRSDALLIALYGVSLLKESTDFSGSF